MTSLPERRIRDPKVAPGLLGRARLWEFAGLGADPPRPCNEVRSPFHGLGPWRPSQASSLAETSPESLARSWKALRNLGKPWTALGNP